MISDLIRVPGFSSMRIRGRNNERDGDRDKAHFIVSDANRTLLSLGNADTEHLVTKISVSRELLREITVEDPLRYELRSPKLLNREDRYALSDRGLIDDELANPYV